LSRATSPTGPLARWTDSHCHLQDEPDPAAAVSDGAGVGVERLVCVGTDADWSARAVELAEALGAGVWATVGLHPHEAKRGLDPIAAMLRPSVRSARVVAVGECGLDYHYDHSPRAIQREVFAAQVDLARQLGLALVIHTREAWDDTFAILAESGTPERTVFHCFTGGPDEARRALDVGAYLSFSGIVTFPSAGEVREAAALCPPERLLVETDAPFLAPVPERGRPNRPAFVPLVGAGVAAARGEAVESVAEASWAAATAAFGLPG
jgi:TatD DNase family protein